MLTKFCVFVIIKYYYFVVAVIVLNLFSCYCFVACHSSVFLVFYCIAIVVLPGPKILLDRWLLCVNIQMTRVRPCLYLSICLSRLSLLGFSPVVVVLH